MIWPHPACPSLRTEHATLPTPRGRDWHGPRSTIPTVALQARICVDDAAIDRDGGADHVISGAGGKVDRSARHVLVGADAPRRHVLCHLVGVVAGWPTTRFNDYAYDWMLTRQPAEAWTPQSVVVAIFWRRRLHKQFPVFFLFLLVQVVNFAVIFPLWCTGNNRLYFVPFWLGEAVNAVLGFKVIHEIFLDVFRPSARACLDLIASRTLQLTPIRIGQFIGECPQIRHGIIAEEEANPRIVIPTIEIMRLREIGVAAQHDLAEARFDAELDGSVRLGGRAFV